MARWNRFSRYLDRDFWLGFWELFKFVELVFLFGGNRFICFL